MKRAGGITRQVCLAAVMAFTLTGCKEKSPLDPDEPVTLTVWHYYNGF